MQTFYINPLVLNIFPIKKYCIKIRNDFFFKKKITFEISGLVKKNLEKWRFFYFL